MDKFHPWIAANHLELFYSLAVAYLLPALLALVVKPPPGSAAAAWLGVAASWGFDAAKFAEKIREAFSGPPKPRGIARLHTLGFVACVSLAAVGQTAGCSWLKANSVPLIHAAEGACSVVPLLLSDGTATAVCVVIEDLAALVELLAKAERAGKAARFELSAADGSKRVVEVSAGHVPQAHAEAKAAHARASK